ncbi:MAG: hypothetical protein GY820_25210 [Gammaproteobacteria bacterium]|nr:hypothetical protein [Gammaproteobacteria bacterium]
MSWYRWKNLIPAISLLLYLIHSSALALSLQSVSMEPRAFNPAEHSSIVLRFALDEEARVILNIYDTYEHLVGSVKSSRALSAGEHQLIWDGRDLAGQALSAGAYHYVVEARAEGGISVTHDLTDLTGGKPLAVNDVHWDPLTKQVHYTLTRSARVSLRAGISNYGPLLKTLLDWVPRQAGRHSLSWNGWDESKVLNVAAHPNLEILATAFELPQNTILILPLADVPVEPRQQSGVIQQRKSKHITRSRQRDYAQQSALERRDVALTMQLVRDYPVNKEGVALVTGKVPVRIDIAEARYAALFGQRFEPIFFADGIFLAEIEVGFLPTTYVWDSSEYNPGLHYLTVNIVGYEGSMGSATIKLQVEAQ